MASFISHLTQSEQQQLFNDLNYLNLKEIRVFCNRHNIPYKIQIETNAGERKKTKDTDRKSVVLARIRHYLNTGQVPAATCFPAPIVRLDGPPGKLTASDRLYYGWYDKNNPAVIALLLKLTNGQFSDGAIARILARKFWTNGKAPTFAEFARTWLKANDKGLGVPLGLQPEAAWLTDRARNKAGKDWKAKRQRKADHVLTILSAI